MSKDNEKEYNYAVYAGWQIQHLNDEFQRLKPSQFSSEDDYRAALIDQYRNLRQKEYEITAYNVGLEMYRDSEAVIRYTHDKKAMNTHIWNGLQEIPESVVPADSVARRTPEHVMYQYTNSGKQDLHCCAITGSTVVQAICDKMDCRDDANIVQFDGTPGKIVPSHTSFHHRHTGAGGFMSDPNAKGYTGKGKLGELIQEGKIGPGDRIASSNGADATNTTTGMHERTVIAVEKDANGKIIGYTLQANNSVELSFHRIPGDKMNNTQVLYASTSVWMKDQIDQECLDLEHCSTQEIQEQIDAHREKTAEIIRDTVENKERSLLEGNVNPQFSEKYEKDYNVAQLRMREEQASLRLSIRQQVSQLDLLKKGALVQSPQDIHVLSILQTQEDNSYETAKEETSQTVDTPEAKEEPQKTDAEKLMALRGLAKEDNISKPTSKDSLYTYNQINNLRRSGYDRS